jgi:hypothetical protein
MNYQPENINSRKRSQRITKGAIENSKSFTFDDDDNEEDAQENDLPKHKRKSGRYSRSSKRGRRN